MEKKIPSPDGVKKYYRIARERSDGSIEYFTRNHDFTGKLACAQLFEESELETVRKYMRGYRGARRITVMVKPVQLTHNFFWAKRQMKNGLSVRQIGWATYEFVRAGRGGIAPHLYEFRNGSGWTPGIPDYEARWVLYTETTK